MNICRGFLTLNMSSARCGRHMLSSSKGIGVTEARAMADILTEELGVREERLLLEEEARSTIENAINVLRYYFID